VTDFKITAVNISQRISQIQEGKESISSE